MYICIRKPDADDSRYSGKILLERSVVACAQVSQVSVPKYQPIGTPEERDTPSGKKRKHRTEATSKTVLAQKMEQRAAAKAE